MKNFLIHVMAVVIVAIWGATFISSKILLAAGLTPALLFSLRFIIAYAGIWLMCLIRKDLQVWKGLSDELIYLVLGLTGGSLYFLTENTALEYTQACNCSFLVCSTPLVTLILTLIVKGFFKGGLVDGLEDVKMTWNLILGTLLAVGGMAVVVFNGMQLKLSPKGDLLAIAASLCWGVYSLFMGQMSEKNGAVFSTRKVFFYGLLTIIPVLLIQGQGIDWTMFADVTNLLNLLFLGVVASLGCFFLWNVVMVRLGNVSSTNYIYLNPVFTFIAAALILGERMTLLSTIGSLSILAGVILAGRRG